MLNAHFLKKLFLLFTGVCVVVVFYLIGSNTTVTSDYVDDNVPDSSELSTEVSSFPDKKEDVKHILYWTPQFDRKDFELGLGSGIFENCAVKSCFATADKTSKPVEQFDAVLFHAVEFKIEKHGLPSKRSPHQKYVYANLESPSYLEVDIKPFSGFYNWTMTYRTHSDLVRPYGWVVPQETDRKPPTSQQVQNKDSLIAWFVSNCKTHSKRELLVRELQKHVPVDVYGPCGPFQCSRRLEKKCYEMLEKKYKFYISFENSYCDEYVTEKLFKVLNTNTVPIVYGRMDYEGITPPHSVINVEDFENVTDLVSYLLHLDKNSDEYLKYFEWKRFYVVDNTNQRVLCQMCQKLHDPERETSVYSNIYEWWYGKNNNACKEGGDLPKIVLDLLPN